MAANAIIPLAKAPSFILPRTLTDSARTRIATPNMTSAAAPVTIPLVFRTMSFMTLVRALSSDFVARSPLVRVHQSSSPIFRTAPARMVMAVAMRIIPTAAWASPPRPLSLLNLLYQAIMPNTSARSTDIAVSPTVSFTGSTMASRATDAASTPSAAAISRSVLAFTSPVRALRWSLTASITAPNFLTMSLTSPIPFLTFLVTPARLCTSAISIAPIPAPMVRLSAARNWFMPSSLSPLLKKFARWPPNSLTFSQAF